MKNFTLTNLLTLCMAACLAQPTVNIVPFATGINEGISNIENAGDSRLFVTEQLGYISIIDTDGVVSPRLFLNIHAKVTPNFFSAGNEQGLLGLAFSPNYATDGYFYVNYTNKTGIGNTVIARYQVSNDPDSADVASEQILLNIYQPYSNHNGGCLKFGNDGFLYCALGDGGSFGDPGNRAQNTDSLLGKILRIDVSGGAGYSIPPTNPFATTGGAPEIWAYGMRNPWRMSFDRLTNNLWIGDVGQGSWEEIDFQSASSAGGENYGWRCYEGAHPYNTTGCGLIGTYTAPAFEYSHSVTGGCSVTGGFVYRGAAFPDLLGYYFYSDYCNGKIYALSSAFAGNTAGTFSGKSFVTFGENTAGELFIGDQTTSTIYRMVSTLVSVKDLPGDVAGFNFYPVPNNGLFTCELTLKSTSKAEIIITDATGKTYFNADYSLPAGQNSIPIDISKASAGIYFLKITTSQGSVNKKFEMF